MTPRPTRLLALLFFATTSAAFAHTATLPQHLLAQTTPPLPRETGPTVPLTLEVTLDDSPEPIAALVRLTALPSNKPVALPEHFRRPMHWFSIPPRTTLQVPAGELRLEICHGLGTEVATLTRTFAAPPPGTTPAPHVLKVPLRRFYRPAARRIVSANTHVHLQFNNLSGMVAAHLRTRREAEDYLHATTRSDGLEFVYVSHLEREGETDQYISNAFTPDVLARWSTDRLRFIYSEEHRHEGGRSARRGNPDELRYGHVLFLDLPELVQPASYGAIFTRGREISDAVPMRRAITEARAKNATIVWCHGKQGTEDIPNWAAGLLHAQNIYDGGTDGTFDTLYYPYLNAGLRVPFSTGTDWGIYDFSRVYTPRGATEPTSHSVLENIRAGRTFITNGPFLEFTVNDLPPGDTLDLSSPTRARILARAAGRDDFTRLELVHNGKVIAHADARATAAHFTAELDTTLELAGPGWLAVRVVPTRPYNDRTQYTGPGANLFGKALFAHTSPVYLTLNGQPLRDPAALRTLISELESAIALITAKGAFATSAERDHLLALYHDAIRTFSAHLRP